MVDRRIISSNFPYNSDGSLIGLGLHSVSQGLFAIAEAIKTLAPQDIPPVEREYNPYKDYEKGMDQYDR